MSLGWLKSPLMCQGELVLPSLSPDQITDCDLPDICLRMFLILDSIEFERCEGRLINAEIFDAIDTLEYDLRRKSDSRLADWRNTVNRFGEYYGLDGQGPIAITRRSINGHSYISSRHGLTWVALNRYGRPVSSTSQ